MKNPSIIRAVSQSLFINTIFRGNQVSNSTLIFNNFTFGDPLKIPAITIAAVMLFLAGTDAAFCDPTPSYSETVAFIRETMSSRTSLFRKESYDYINFDRCKLSYMVAGTYPAGGTYHIKYSNLDFSGLDPRRSKISHDYTAFLILNFANSVIYDTGSEKLDIRTVVINTADDKASDSLLEAFLRLGDLCRNENVCNTAR